MKVLITGGTNGMGKGVAKALAAHSEVEIVILGRSQERGRETCEELSHIASRERISFVHSMSPRPQPAWLRAIGRSCGTSASSSAAMNGPGDVRNGWRRRRAWHRSGLGWFRDRVFLARRGAPKSSPARTTPLAPLLLNEHALFAGGEDRDLLVAQSARMHLGTQLPWTCAEFVV